MSVSCEANYCFQPVDWHPHWHSHHIRREGGGEAKLSAIEAARTAKTLLHMLDVPIGTVKAR
jgi:hypothetical protein